MEAKLFGTISKMERNENEHGYVIVHVHASGKVESTQISTKLPIEIDAVINLKSAVANNIKLGASIQFLVDIDNETAPAPID